MCYNESGDSMDNDIEIALQAMYSELRFYIHTHKIGKDSDLDFGKYNDYTDKQIIALSSLIKKCKKMHYSKEITLKLISLYEESIKLDYLMCLNPDDNEMRDRYLKILRVLDPFGIRDNITIDDILTIMDKKGSELPDSEKMYRLINIVKK